jgi:phosphate transport system substrate-binding protein
MTDAELAQAQGVLHIPTCVGCVVAAYNIPGVQVSIRLTGAVLAEMFTGKVGTWNHPSIAALNPGIKLPAIRVVPVSRADSSGTTAIFTSYLTRVSPSFKAEIGEGKSVNIKVGVKGKGNDGVAALVRQTPGAVGYVELAFAEKNKMPFATIQNAKGNWIVASIRSATESATAKDLPADFRAMITNTQDKEGYPIAGFTWLLMYPNAKREVKDFIRWCLTDGQKLAAKYDYAPLPESVRRRAFATIGK